MMPRSSKKLVLKLILLPLAVILVVAGVFCAVLAFPISTQQFKGRDGRALPNSIASVERWEIDGVTESVIIRGRDRTAPLLIWLHGGPGTSETAWFRRFNAALEDAFVVVYWDQRYAGQSFHPALPPPAQLTIAAYTDDLDVLVDRLRSRFGHDKVNLVGHSWGTVVGVLYAQRHPEKVHAYVGVGQVVAPLESERRSYAFAVAQARARGNTKALAELTRIGPPPRPDGSIMTPRDLLQSFGGAFHAPMTYEQLALISLRSRETNWRDAFAVLRGEAYADPLTREFSRLALNKTALTFRVPVFILAGRYDQQANADLAHQYFEMLSAPKKEFHWFEGSGHNPPFEEPDEFNAWIISHLGPDASLN